MTGNNQIPKRDVDLGLYADELRAQLVRASHETALASARARMLEVENAALREEVEKLKAGNGPA